MGNSTWLDRPENWPGEYVESINLNEQDACPFQAGSSNQQGVYGCPDFDGDGWYDNMDGFVQEASQWLDSDGDGLEIIWTDSMAIIVQILQVIQIKIEMVALTLMEMVIQILMNFGRNIVVEMYSQ